MRSTALVVLSLASAACGSLEPPPDSAAGALDLGVDRVAGPATGRDRFTWVAPESVTAGADPMAFDAFEADGFDSVARGLAPFETTVSFAPQETSDDRVGKPYTMLRLAAFEPVGDIDSLDTGFIGELEFGNKFLPFLAIEGSAGYFQADGFPGGGKLWGIPLFANAKVTIPIVVVEPYVGAGVGGIYTDFPGNTDWVGAWNAFAGLAVGVGQLAVGVDYRYIRTGETSAGFDIEAHTLGAFVSLPF
jgi:hypothetical protein